MFFPLQSPGSLRGGNPRKMGKNYKIPLPGPTPENGEKLPKNYHNTPNTFFGHFSIIFPFSQRAQRSKKFNLARKFHSRSKFSISLEISNFFVDIWALWFFGGNPGGFRGSVRGKQLARFGRFFNAKAAKRNFEESQSLHRARD